VGRRYVGRTRAAGRRVANARGRRVVRAADRVTGDLPGAQVVKVRYWFGAGRPYAFVIGRRRSRPNAFGVIFTPGGAWRRLYSARSTMRPTRRTSSARMPSRTR